MLSRRGAHISRWGQLQRVWMIPGEAHVFEATEIEQAKEWVAGGAA